MAHLYRVLQQLIRQFNRIGLDRSEGPRILTKHSTPAEQTVHFVRPGPSITTRLAVTPTGGQHSNGISCWRPTFLRNVGVGTSSFNDVQRRAASKCVPMTNGLRCACLAAAALSAHNNTVGEDNFPRGPLAEYFKHLPRQLSTWTLIGQLMLVTWHQWQEVMQGFNC